MLEESLSTGASPVHGLDPRVRVLAAAIFAVTVAVSTTWFSVTAGMAVAVVAAYTAGVPVRVVWLRLSRLNLLLTGLLAFLLLGEMVTPRGGMGAALTLGLLIMVKANAIVLCLSALIGTVSALDLGHALWRLGVPTKLTYLLLLTVRYLDVLHRELDRLRMAMRARAFEPRIDRHTLRALGYLVGMLMVRAFDRSERIHDAMRCRGFCGTYPVVAEYRLGARDVVFAGAWCTMIALITLGNVV